MSDPTRPRVAQLVIIVAVACLGACESGATDDASSTGAGEADSTQSASDAAAAATEEDSGGSGPAAGDTGDTEPAPPAVPSDLIAADEADPAPELDGGLAWLNTDAPLRLEDLHGHVVLLDFWTYGCVNCLHIIPVLRALEERFHGQPFVVIGVHSGKFSTEWEAANIQQAIQQYDVRHPVVVDDDRAIWDAYNVSAWPTTVLIDAEGRIRRKRSGEFSENWMTTRIEPLLYEAYESGVAADPPLDLIQDPNEGMDTPLLFPGKVLALPDGRVAVADSAHHRIVIRGADGNFEDIVGSGIEGANDGAFATASFRRPQGMAWYDDKLWIADVENHLIRVADLTSREVSTVAGVGKKGTEFYAVSTGWIPGLECHLRSPWDLEQVTLDDGEVGLAIAMAGSHQIFVLDPETHEVRVLSGNSKEAIDDKTLSNSTYAQPSGLAASADGTILWVADSESSAVRELDLVGDTVTTLVGKGLFVYGDEDGVGDEVRLEHATGIERLADGTLMLADTYNDKIKLLDPATRTVTTPQQPLVDELPLFQPRGLSRAGDVMWAVDTNNHRLLRHDLVTGEWEGAVIKGLNPPALSGAVSDP